MEARGGPEGAETLGASGPTGVPQMVRIRARRNDQNLADA